MRNISKPSRYYGVEINPKSSVPRNPSLKIALSFPEVYELGMSHYGYLLLYHLLREKEKYLVDRVFAPWTDMEEKIRKEGKLLNSYEHGIPLCRFDVIGFSLAYELSLTNVLTILDLGRIPLLVRERTENDPLVISGGALSANPEPFSDFIDAVFIGEGEEGLMEMLALIESEKRNGSPRNEILRSLTEIEGVYVPSLYKPVYEGDNILTGYDVETGAPPAVTRRIVPDLEKYPPPSGHILPSMRIVHDRLPIEIARGCTRGCRFCQAGYYYRPFRERKADSVLDYLNNNALRSGFDEVGFLSLSSSDYSCINELIKESMDILEKEKISISLPSLRINTISEDLIGELKRVRKGGFTIAPEAGRESLRRRINKDITDEEIFSTVDWIFQKGWNRVKMYFMIGLPGETEQDLHGIVDLSKKAGHIARRYGKKRNITVSITTFVPKPHTPFQWSSQIGREEMEDTIKIMKRKFSKDRNITLKWHSPQMSWLEGIISRGDRNIGLLIARAYELGARFDGWSDRLNIEVWERAMASLNIDPNLYTGLRETDQFLPWDMIKTGTSKEFFLREWNRSLKGETSPDCRISGCSGCGICSPGNTENRLSPPVSTRPKLSSPPFKKSDIPPPGYIVTFRKVGNGASQSALELQSLISRTLRKSGLPVKYSEGFNPKPKISFPAALPVGVESRSEFFLIQLTEKVSPGKILSSLSKHLPFELAPISVMPAQGKVSSLTLEEVFEILPESDNGSLPDMRPDRQWERVPELKEVEKKGDKIFVTAIIPAEQSIVKKMGEAIFGCTLTDLEIKITKTSSIIYLESGDEQRQIYPHKQPAVRNPGGGSRK